MLGLGLYFSGTGNTKLCLDEFISNLDNDYPILSIEEDNVLEAIKKSDVIFLGYPIYYSNMPLILRDFINDNKEIWFNKKIYIITTMGLFSGDGSGCAARLLKKHGAIIEGGLHVKMKDCIIDIKLLKKTKQQEANILIQAKLKITNAAKAYQLGKPTQQGLSFGSQLLGLFGQRLWFYKKSITYHNLPNVKHENCIKCSACIKICPMNNLGLDNKIINYNKCTLCYRCVHICPTQAITILGKQVIHNQSDVKNLV